METESSNIIKELFIVAGVWGFFALFLLQMSAPTRRLHRFKSQRPRRLCGYHLASEMRPGCSAIVDSARCERCEYEHTLRTYGSIDRPPNDAA